MQAAHRALSVQNDQSHAESEGEGAGSRFVGSKVGSPGFFKVFFGTTEKDATAGGAAVRKM
jgi:hypothetical protein